MYKKKGFSMENRPMRRRILALLAAVVMVGGLAGLVLPGGVAKADTNIVTWADLQAAIENTTNTETVFIITGNLSANSTITIPAGKNITIKSDNTKRTIVRETNPGFLNSFFDVKGTLTLENIVLDGQELFAMSLVSVHKSGTLNLNDGATFQKNKGKDTTTAGGVHNFGTFNMSGGLITENYSSFGGGVYNEGIFNMSGGLITKNSSNEGGGVYCPMGNLNMSGGLITGNSSNEGGGVYCTFGYLYINGGSIKENSAKKGGGVYLADNYTKLNLSSGEISSNEASIDGGGVYIASDASCTLSGGEISSNKASNDGGGVYNVDGAFTLSGGKIESNNATRNGGGVYNNHSFTMTGGSMSGNSAMNGIDIYTDKSAVISGGTTTNSENAVYVSSNGDIRLTGNPKISGVYVNRVLSEGIHIGGKITEDSFVVVKGNKDNSDMAVGKAVSSSDAAHIDATAAGMFKNTTGNLVGALSEDGKTIVWKAYPDLTELNKAIGVAEGLTESDYSAASWAGLAKALSNAKAAKTAKTQTAVDDATKALNDAIADLKFDTMELEKAIVRADKQLKDDYTAATWAVLEPALAAAKAMLSKPTSKTAIDAVTAALNTATNGLVTKQADLKATIDAAKKETKGNKSDETWNAFQAAIKAAEAAVNTGTNDEIAAAKTALDAASKALKDFDNSKLQAAINKAKALPGSTYTASSWTAVQTALTAAEKALAGSSQADIDAALDALDKAINALQKRPNPPTTNPNPSPTETMPKPTVTSQTSPKPTVTSQTSPKPSPAATTTPKPTPQDKPTPGWNNKEGNPPRYINPDGTPAKGWKKLVPPGGGDPVWFYFDEDGYAVSGWLKLDKNADGTDRWYYLYPADGGTAETPAYSLAVGWHKLHWKGSDNWYYFRSDGVMYTGWLKQGKNADGTDRWYYLKPFRLRDQPLGSMATGWVKIMYKGVPTWFYFAESGANIGVMQTGWVYWKGHWYYLDKNGAMVTGWKQIMYKGKLCWFYFEPSTGKSQPQGSMYTGSHTIGDKKYSFQQSGVYE